MGWQAVNEVTLGLPHAEEAVEKEKSQRELAEKKESSYRASALSREALMNPAKRGCG